MKLKSFLAVALAAMLTLWAGCGTTSAYNGPYTTTPIVHTEVFRHVNSMNPKDIHWESHKVVVFDNPMYYRTVSFNVDCEWNFFNIDVPPRTTQRLLVTDQDGSCKISRTR